jgi:hypothetical protein
MAGRVDLATGGGLCAVAVLTGVVWAIAWRRRLRTDGVLPRRKPRPSTVIAPVPPEEAQTQAIPVPEQLRATPAAPSTATAVAETPARGTSATASDAAPRSTAGTATAVVHAPVPGAEGKAPPPAASAPGTPASPALDAPEAEHALETGAAAAVPRMQVDTGTMDLRALLAPLVDALAEDTERARCAGAVRGFAGRPAYDYAEETW